MKIFRIPIILSLIAIPMLLLMEGRCEMITANDNQNDFKEERLVVCFKEGVSKEDAEMTLSKYSIKFEHTKDPEIEEFVFYKGEKFIIKVPEGEEGYQTRKILSKDEKIKAIFWHPDDLYIKGEVVVGFEKGVSRKEAEKILSGYNLKFQSTASPCNLGKGFFYKTGEKFIIKVPEGKEKYWIEKLEKEKKIKQVNFHPDRNKIMVD